MKNVESMGKKIVVTNREKDEERQTRDEEAVAGIWLLMRALD